MQHRNRTTANLPLHREKQAEIRNNYKLSIPNPLSTLIILLDKEAAVILAGGLRIVGDYEV